jgi:hypothetical protein
MHELFNLAMEKNTLGFSLFMLIQVLMFKRIMCLTYTLIRFRPISVGFANKKNGYNLYIQQIYILLWSNILNKGYQTFGVPTFAVTLLPNNFRYKIQRFNIIRISQF